jgi:hypothetical protein
VPAPAPPSAPRWLWLAQDVRRTRQTHVVAPTGTAARQHAALILGLPAHEVLVRRERLAEAGG